MPPAIIAAAIGGAASIGSSIYSGSQQKKATNKAVSAQEAASQAQLADQQAARQQITQLQAPFVQGGVSALDAIMQKYGLGDTSTATGGKAPGAMTANYGTPQGGAPQPDWNGWLSANPDVVEYYNQTADAKQSYPNIQDFAASIYEQQKDYRSAPPMSGQPPAAQAPQAPAAAPAPYVPQYDRPEQPVWEGAGPAPNQAEFLDPSKFKESEGYKFRTGQDLRNLNQKFGARGLLSSGAAIKGFSDYSQGAASQEYGNWFNQQKSLYETALGQYNADRSANYNIFTGERNNLNQNFADDRSYGTNLGLNNRNFDTAQAQDARNFGANRDDTQTANLYRLIGIGTGAAGATGQAASNYANNAGDIYGNNANAQANAAYGNAGANASMVGGIAGTVANFANAYAGTPRIGAGVGAGNTSGTVDLGSLNYGNIYGSSNRIGAF